MVSVKGKFFVSLLWLSLLSLSACMPIGADDDSTQAQWQKNEEKLKALYANVVGTYMGQVEVSGRANALSASFIFYTVKVDDGIDANNVPKTHTELRAQLRFDQVGEYDDHVFKVDYKEHTGEFYMTQIAQAAGAGCQVGPRDTALQVRGHLIDGNLRGDLISTGKVGSLQMVRKSAQTEIPPRDQAQRLMRAFARISGTYDGAVGSPDSPLAARVVLRVEQYSAGPGLNCPELVGYFRYKNAIGELDDSSFKVTYRESTGEILFNYKGSAAAGVCPVGPTDRELKIEGFLNDSRLWGTMTGATSDFGPVVLAKVSENTEIENDQTERLVQAYSKIVGTYGGRFTAYTGDSKGGFPVKIVVNLISKTVNSFVTCPALSAQYYRPDMTVDPSIGMLLLAVDYYPRANRLVFKTDPQMPTSGLPGSKNLHIDANLSAFGFSGRMTWWNRSGVVEMKRCSGDVVTAQGECK
mgnify:CR=1 FL=1